MSDEEDDGYPSFEKIDFQVLTTRWRDLALIEEDLYLGMQGMNLGVTDSSITAWEYDLLSELIRTERTPMPDALHVSAFSQMWIYAAYEVMRIWRDRIFTFRKWHVNGGIETELKRLASTPEDVHLPRLVRQRNLERYRDDQKFRERTEREWSVFEPSYRKLELLRMNLAKHAAPGKDSMMTRAPGYGRIDGICGSMNFEVVDKDGNESYVSRRDIAESLRASFAEIPPAN